MHTQQGGPVPYLNAVMTKGDWKRKISKALIMFLCYNANFFVP